MDWMRRDLKNGSGIRDNTKLYSHNLTCLTKDSTNGTPHNKYMVINGLPLIYFVARFTNAV